MWGEKRRGKGSASRQPWTGAMSDYNAFAKHYDVLMGEREESAAQVQSLIDRYHPKACSVLELGCGTGAVLKHLSQKYEVAGVDLSASMLKIAQRKLPKVKFSCQNIAKLKVERQYDLVLCLFDTINHLTSFADWKSVFQRAAASLNEKGVFIFDMNTLWKLQKYTDEPAFAEFHKNGICIFDARHRSGNRYAFDLRLLKKLPSGKYQLFEAEVRELGVSTVRVVAALKKQFSKVTLWDAERARPSGRSEELYFICRK